MTTPPTTNSVLAAEGRFAPVKQQKNQEQSATAEKNKDDQQQLNGSIDRNLEHGNKAGQNRTMEPTSYPHLPIPSVNNSTQQQYVTSNIAQIASKSVSGPTPAMGSTSGEPYDIQMDQFQVIEAAKDKSSYLLMSSTLGNPESHGTTAPVRSPDHIQNENNDNPVTISGTGAAKTEKDVQNQQNINIQQNLNVSNNASNSGPSKSAEPANSFRREHHATEEDKAAQADVDEQQQQDATQFFLTGVNVQNQDIEPYAIMEKGEKESEKKNEKEDGDIDEVLDLLAKEEFTAMQVDKYKMVAVVDAGRSFANNECVYVNMPKNEICHLSVDSHTSLNFDELISSYDQVFKIGKAMAHTFMTRRNTNKVILNVADQFATNNNCGFNLANFKLKFLKNYFNEVVQDYERSFIGSFTHALLQTYMPNSNDQFELFFTIAKFEGNMGYSLTQNFDENNKGPQDPELQQQQQHQTEASQLDAADTPQNNILEAKGLQGSEVVPQLSDRVARLQQLQKHTSKLVQERRQEILKKGSIPEFVQISNTKDYYYTYQEANHRNKLLVESQRQQQQENFMKGEPYDHSKESEPQNIDLKNIKDDIVIMQFKLVKKDSMKVINTQTFINVPTSKMNDINISTLLEIIQKQNQQNPQMKKQPRKETSQFLPYNKSILTRILYPCLNKSNFLIINHYSKKTILRHLKQPITGYQAGPAKGLFSSLFRLGFDTLNRLKKRKLQKQDALKILQRTFKTELTSIFKEIEMFREGIKSFEVYTEQTANQLLKQGMQGLSRGTNPLTMFHQIMYFLVLQEDMQQDAENFCTNGNSGNVSQTNPMRSSNFFPSLLPEEEIQKVIFDSNYCDYIQKKQLEAQQKREQNDLFFNIQGGGQEVYQSGSANMTNNVYSNNNQADLLLMHQQQSNDDQLSSVAGTAYANTSIQMAAQLAKESQMPQGMRQHAVSEKEKKLQFVQYECIKSELKDEYDKRVGFLHKRLNKKAQMDPSFLLLNSMAQQPLSTRNVRSGAGSLFQGSGGYGQHDIGSAGAERAKQLGQQMMLQKKILGGPKNRLTKSRTSQGAPIQPNDRRRAQNYASYDREMDDDKQNPQQRKAEYYKFYLDNAQKAIDLMIEQHKSQGNLQKAAGMRSQSGIVRAQSHSSGDHLSQEDPINVNGSFEGDQGNSSQVGRAAGYAGSGQSRRIQGGGPTNVVNRSNSLHERKFQPGMGSNQQRLEPLVQRHTKINRITVRNSNEGCFEMNNLEKIDEARHDLPAMAQPKSGGSISINQRRSKPYSANLYTSNKRRSNNVGGGGGVYVTKLNQPEKYSVASQGRRINNQVVSQAQYNSESLSKQHTESKGATSTTNNFVTRKYASNTGQKSHSSIKQPQQSENNNYEYQMPTRYGEENTGFTSSDGNLQQAVAQQYSSQQKQVLNASSDQKLIEKRPFTSGQVSSYYTNGLQMTSQVSDRGGAGATVLRLDQMQAERESNNRRASQQQSMSNQYMQSQGAASKSFSMAKRGSNMLPPTGQRNQTAKRISSNQQQAVKSSTANRVGGGVRGELLTNGYKSLRAQGRLRANKVGNGAANSGDDYSGTKNDRKPSKEIENVNICIEQTAQFNNGTSAPSEDIKIHAQQEQQSSQQQPPKQESPAPIVTDNSDLQ